MYILLHFKNLFFFSYGKAFDLVILPYDTATKQEGKFGELFSLNFLQSCYSEAEAGRWVYIELLLRQAKELPGFTVHKFD